jgi:hypothetical protein
MNYRDLHAAFWWVVLFFVVIVIARALPAWLRKRDYTIFDSFLSVIFALVMLIEMVFGVFAYFQAFTLSPKVLEHIVIGFMAVAISWMLPLWRKVNSAKRHRIFFATGMMCLMLIFIGFGVLRES